MSILVLSVIVVVFVFDLLITVLNFNQRKLPLPENVRGIYDEAAYQKWLSYTNDKLRMEWIGKTINLVMMVLLLSLGFFGALESLASSLSPNPIVQTLIFLGLFMGLTSLLSLPFEWIDTFKIEAKYGFNTTTPKTFWIDQIKGLALGSLLFGVLVSILNGLYLTFQTRLVDFAVTAWLVIMGVMVALFILNVKVFVRLFNKLKPIEDAQLKEKINALASQAGFNVKSIFTMDASKRSTKLNGFYSGLGKTGEIVLYDTLLNKMNHEEILAVLAHELGHAKHKDTLRMLIVQNSILGTFMIGIAWILSTPSLFTAFGLSGIHFGFAFVLFTILIEPLTLIYGVQTNAMLRQAEFKADAFSVQLTSKEAMSSVMKILVTENFSNLNPHPLYVLLHYSHPPISERLKAIQEVTI